MHAGAQGSRHLQIAEGELCGVNTGAKRLVHRADGMLYLELFTARDDISGDTQFPAFHSAAWYRRVLRSAGLVGCGMHCYLPRALVDRLAELERSL